MVDIITSAVGRIVQGDCYNAQPVTDDDNKPKFAADGKPKMQVFLALAFPKGEPTSDAFIGKLNAAAKTAWPQYFDAAGNCTNPSFSSKIVDGDGKDGKGVPHSRKDGFAGCWVVKFTRNIPPFSLPQVLEFDTALGAWRATAPGKIKRGDYVRVTCDTNSNAPSKTDGMYVNLGDMIAFDHEGDMIVGSGPTAADAFGTPGNAAPAATSPAAGAATSQASGTAGAGSYTGFMDTDAPPPPADDAPPPPSGPQMTDKAGGKPYESFIAKGWTDVQLRANGYIV